MEPALILMPIFGSAVLIVAIVMAVEYRKISLRNRERLAAIEKGLPLADLSKAPKPELSLGKRSLYRGIMLVFIGGGLTGALYVSAGAVAAVWGGFIAFIGLGNLAYWVLVGRHEKPEGNGCC